MQWAATNGIILEINHKQEETIHLFLQWFKFNSTSYVIGDQSEMFIYVLCNIIFPLISFYLEIVFQTKYLHSPIT